MCMSKMHRPKKSRRLDGSSLRNDDVDLSLREYGMNNLSTDELAKIFSFLPHEDIMYIRRVCTTWRDAAKETIAPMTEFAVDSLRKYKALVTMSTALPNLQQITLRRLGRGHKYSSDGGEPCGRRINAMVTNDISFISRFKKLRSLELSGAPLYGRYSVLFDFPLLQKLTISSQHKLEFDLEMLAGLPQLRELSIPHGNLTGDIKSLRVLKDTIEKMILKYCRKVEGNFIELADFPHLRELDLWSTNVIGDIRDVGDRDFVTMEALNLPSSVYGGVFQEFQLISDVREVMSALYPIKKHRPKLLKEWAGALSRRSPDWYEGIADRHENDCDTPPLLVYFVQAGPRLGYQWNSNSYRRYACEVIWLDPEPDQESSDYEKYIEELPDIERHILYRGFQEPPTEDEFFHLFANSFGFRADSNDEDE